ncbi:hypothetical protein PPACK8108_LOCUS12981 [Phakopsora pachyrhizi]|uniref:Chromatin assembly factor 1 subunit A dimerization domain-containing protein n=1 Tax=Phakopsora pachyrhizi TaxID=170000 RepID=A0AAV0B2M9_PHAPC|nr:hypothetical protein PPACK8108_LOCUS12981 [Phakopsora pachyrhizi]
MQVGEPSSSLVELSSSPKRKANTVDPGHSVSSLLPHQAGLPSSGLDESRQTKKFKVDTKPSDATPNHEKTVVELDVVKLNISVKQKTIELCEVSNSVKKELVAITEALEASEVHQLDFSTSQLNLIACLVHESDKTLGELVRYVHSKLLPQCELEDDDGSKPFDPLPLTTLEIAINAVAKRLNYAPTSSDIEWLPATLPKNFQLWRWEVNDRASVIPNELKAKYEKRWEERQLIKPQLCARLASLSPDEREALLKKLSPGRRKSKAPTTITIEKSSQAPSQIILDSPTSPAAALISSSLQSNTEHSRLESNKMALSTKEVVKQQREQKRREKEEVKQAAEQQKKRMENMMNGWISKSTPTQVKPICIQSSTAFQEGETDSASLLKQDIVVIEPDKPAAFVEEKNQRKSSDYEKAFKPFNVRANVDIAPINRFRSSCDTEEDPKKLINIPTDFSTKDCLAQFFASTSAQRKSSSSHKAHEIKTVREIVNGIAESEMSGNIEDTKRWRRKLQNRNVVPLKFLRFHEDVRPGYVGTWSKNSRLVSGRNPYGKDTCLFNYDYDSEADWAEEDGEGEDLGASDDGPDDGESLLSEADSEDGWLVGDDDEIEVMEGDLDDANTAHSNEPELEGGEVRNKHLKKISGHSRRKITGPLIPVIKGPCWEKSLGEPGLSNFESLRIQFINSARVGINPLKFVPTIFSSANHCKLKGKISKPNSLAPAPIFTAINHPSKVLAPLPINQSFPVSICHLDKSLRPVLQNSSNNPKSQKSSKHNFPVELVPAMVKLVNGNTKAKPLLLEDLRVAFLEHGLSKRAIERKLGDVAVKVGGVWRVVEMSNDGPTQGTFV